MSTKAIVEAKDASNGWIPSAKNRSFTFETELHAVSRVKWTVNYKKSGRTETNRSNRCFDDFRLSCEERRINVSVKALSMAHVHGCQEWDFLLSGDSRETSGEHEHDEGILLQILEPIVTDLHDKAFSLLSGNETNNIHFHSLEVRIDHIEVSYHEGSRGLVDSRISGLQITFGDDEGGLVCSATIMSPLGISYLTKHSVLAIGEVDIVVEDIQYVPRSLGSFLAILNVLQRSVEVSTVTVSTKDGWMSGSLTDLLSELGGSSMCAHVAITFRDGAIISMSGLSFQPSGEVNVESLDTCYLPGLCSLSRKASQVRLSFGLDVLTVCLSGAHLILLRDLMRDSPQFPRPWFQNVSVLLKHLVLEYKGKITLAMRGCRIDALSSEEGNNFNLSCDDLESRMISARNSSISGCFAPNDTIYNLKIRPGEVSVVSDFGTFDWSIIRREALYETNRGSIIKIPNGVIESFSLRVDFHEATLVTEKPHTFPSYKCGPAATSVDFGDYVMKLLVNELPRIYVKTRVMGERATDLTAKAAGRLASSCVPLAAIGSVGALVVTDVIRACSKVKVASILILKKRFGRDRPVPSFVGVLGQLMEYFEQNRTRFGAAAGSTFGIAIGAAFYGLPGMMIGNIAGGKIASSALGHGDKVIASWTENEILLDDDVDAEWVIVDVATYKKVKPRHVVGNYTACLKSSLHHQAALWPQEEGARPSAPVCTKPSAAHHDQHNTCHKEMVPVHLLPASNLQEGYLTAIQKSLFLALRRR